ncbi:MAG: hypothetical protein GF418_13405 [Chitinivibrionales bacterium]|nr:hypothetical protein [Chitinivibrionales bacterium]MBD3396616.1 hypothetical protein [Chitinivibrionales bacterium]
MVKHANTGYIVRVCREETMDAARMTLCMIVFALVPCLAEPVLTEFSRTGYEAWDGITDKSSAPYTERALHYDIDWQPTQLWDGYNQDEFMYVRTFWCDGGYNRDDFLSFKTSRDITVYLSFPRYDPRDHGPWNPDPIVSENASEHLATHPVWLVQRGFEKRGKMLHIVEVEHDVYERTYTAGETVRLGGCGGRTEMYHIFVKTGAHDPKPWTPAKTPDNWQENLPEPVLSEHQGWIDFYYHCWEMAESKKVRRPGVGTEGMVFCFDDAHSGQFTWTWDQVWVSTFAKYWQGAHDVIGHYMNGIDVLYSVQYDDGYIPYMWGTWGDPTRVQAPILSLAEWVCYQHTADTARLHRVLPVLRKYFFNVRRLHGQYYDGPYSASFIGNGMDNRYNGRRIIDLTGQQAMNALLLSRLYGVISDSENSELFHREWEFLREIINDKMWHEENRFYEDLANLTGDGLRTTWTLASYWPLIAEVAPPERAAAMKDHLFDPDNFATPHMPPSSGKKCPNYDPNGCYWQGSVWVPTATMVIRGLIVCGFEDAAREIALNHHGALYRTWLSDHTVYENYWQGGDGPATGVNPKPGFAGWSAVTPIATLIEVIIGIRTNAPENRMFWRPRLTEENGIRNLKWGPGYSRVVDMIAAERSSASDPITITINSNHAFTLEVDAGFATKTIDVAAADGQVFTIE